MPFLISKSIKDWSRRILQKTGNTEQKRKYTASYEILFKNGFSRVGNNAWNGGFSLKTALLLTKGIIVLSEVRISSTPVFQPLNSISIQLEVEPKNKRFPAISAKEPFIFLVKVVN